jgi:prepilin-type N-terminal cleavage/methylation domain-containing protein
MRNMTGKPRPGVTLLEVLVAIFVMGIGLLAILVLFPLGALNMAQAIKDDRTAHCASTAAALAIAENIKNDTNVTSQYQAAGASNSTGPYNWTAYTGPSLPVYVDPFGYNSAITPKARQWVGDLLAPQNVPRCSPSFLPAGNFAMLGSWCMSLDDITFNEGGDPNLQGGEVNRDRLYTWAYLLRRPNVTDATVVNMAVVVYNRRPLQLAGLDPNEIAYSATFDTVNNKVQVTWNATQAAPQIRPGGWFLDATVETTGANQVVLAHGTFYRVRDVVQTNKPNTIDLIPDTPLQDFSQNGTAGTIILLDGVAEVFYKGSVSN